MHLGIDVGTGGTRALLVDGRGGVIGAHTAAHAEMRMARPLWAEQDPDDWWRATQEAVRGALSQAGASGAEVRGIGLSGQMHGLVLLDEADRVLRPALLWCDNRSQAQVDEVHRTLGMERVLADIANPLVTGFTLPKLLWVREHEPELFGRVRRVLLPKDYVRLKLTGEFASEVSDASGTAMFDVVRRRWSEDLLGAVGVDGRMLPRVAESQEVTGTVTGDAAEATGLAAGTPVVGGGGDQAASAVGNGIVTAGVVSCTIGTSGVVFAHMERPQYDPKGRVHTFCHAVPEKWHVMGVTQGAGLSLQWFRNTLAPGTAYDELTREAAGSSPGAGGLTWLPYLMGERTPHLDPLARGGWVGLTARHTRGDLVRAVLEGVCYSQKDGLDIIEELGTTLDTVRLSGGGARSPLWRQLFANVFNKRVVTLETQEGSAYGVALLAMVGTRAFGSVEEACGATIREAGVTEPVAGEVDGYRERHGVYRSLYPAVKGALG